MVSAKQAGRQEAKEGLIELAEQRLKEERS
jgi:hypothetical protein